MTTDDLGRPTVPGLIRTAADATTNDHPMPILAGDAFQLACTLCAHIGVPRTTLQMALADRVIHERTPH